MRRDRRQTATARPNTLYGSPPSAEQRARIRFVIRAFLTAFSVVALRLFQLHLTPHLALTEEEQKHIGQVALHEPRGEVFDRNGLLLATDRQVPSLWADTRRVRDPQRAAILLSARLGLDEDQVVRLLSKRDPDGHPMKFVWLRRWLLGVPESTLTDIEEASGGAVSVRYESLRYYPQGDTAAHLLGFVNRVGEASEGLELLFDAHLRSVPGKHRARKDGRRRLLPSLTLEYTPPKGGEDLYLTLDTDIQHTLERALDVRMEECKAVGAMGMVMEVHSGAILALASRPAFDPNAYHQYPAQLRKNRALLDMFEPGSAFKIVTASAALEHGLIIPETLIDCEGGTFNPYGHRIRDFHKLGVVPFTKCFEESSNIAIIKVGAMLGKERLEAWIRRFGFAARTSSDFQFESPGKFRPLSQWSGLSMGALPMGQEIAVTIPQMARAFAVIANGGLLVEPYFVEQAATRDGKVTYRHQAPTPKRILSDTTAATMRDLCHRVVLYGTGDYASIPEYRVGGKTGTAQMARKDGRGYDPDRYTTVFAGFAPVSNPRLVAVIVVQEPMIRLHYGGYVCGPVFRDVVREALIRLDVPEDPVLDENGQPLKNETQTHKPKNPTLQMAEANEQDADTIVERPDPASLEESLEHLLEPLDGLELVAQCEDHTTDQATLPDLSGLTKRQAKERLAALGIPWDPRGAGWVLAQEPAPGTPLSHVTLCALHFGAKYQTEHDDTQPTM